MKSLFYFSFLFLLGPLTGAAQADLDLSRLRVSGLGATVSQTQVIRHLGQPLAVVNPHYECGEYASQPGGSQFYQLRYSQAVFIGNRQRGYELESFDLALAGPARLTYGNQMLSTSTTLPEFARIFGKLETYNNLDGSVAVIVRQQDASATFTFRAGRLARYEYNGTGC